MKIGFRLLRNLENSDNIVSVSTGFPSTGHVTKISVASNKLLVQELIFQNGRHDL